jgi:hypothetical protein
MVSLDRGPRGIVHLELRRPERHVNAAGKVWKANESYSIKEVSAGRRVNLAVSTGSEAVCLRSRLRLRNLIHRGEAACAAAKAYRYGGTFEGHRDVLE